MKLSELLIGKSEIGRKIHFDLKAKSVSIGKRMVIDKGNIVIEDIELDEPIAEWNELITLYENFKHSTPNKETSRKTYLFKPLSIDELSMSDIGKGESREIAYIKLCTAIIVSAISHSLEWGKGWFKRFDNCDLVVYRYYFE